VDSEEISCSTSPLSTLNSQLFYHPVIPFINAVMISTGTSGHVIAMTPPMMAAINISTKAAIRENMRTKKPTVRDTKLSKSARIFD
jgi:transketolase N-terminal domain/subunit